MGTKQFHLLLVLCASDLNQQKKEKVKTLSVKESKKNLRVAGSTLLKDSELLSQMFKIKEEEERTGRLRTTHTEGFFLKINKQTKITHKTANRIMM